MAADWRTARIYPKAEHGRARTPASRVAVARATEDSEKSDGNGRSARVVVAVAVSL